MSPRKESTLELIITTVAIAVIGILLFVRKKQNGPEDPLTHDLGLVQMFGQMARFYHDNRLGRKSAKRSCSKTYMVIGQKVAFALCFADGKYSAVIVATPEMIARIKPHLALYSSRFTFDYRPAPS